jgi:hypothetical protein
MKTKQMMACPLAEIKTKQEEIMAKMETSQEEMKACQ